MNKFYNNKSAFFAFGFLAALTFFQNVSAQTKNEVLNIADQKIDCRGVAPAKCLQIKRPQDERWTLLRQNIENFDYREGYTYIIRVRSAAAKNSTGDISNSRYKLRSVMYRERTVNENSPANNADLTKNSWKVVAVDDAKINAEKASLRFDAVKNSVGGNGGCNVFGGSYELNGNGLKIGGVYSTKMFCDATSEIENKFLGNLERVTRYEIRGGKLFLYAGETAVLEFAREN